MERVIFSTNFHKFLLQIISCFSLQCYFGPNCFAVFFLSLALLLNPTKGQEMRLMTRSSSHVSVASVFPITTGIRWQSTYPQYVKRTYAQYSQFSILELPKTTGGKTHIKADLEVLDILKVGIK